MSEPVRHHYVPRRYLEEFENAGGGLRGVEKPSGRKFDASPLNSAVQKHLNSVDFFDGTKDQNSIEDFFNLVETEYVSRVNSIRQKDISGDDIDYFLKMAIHQLSRTPRVRGQLADLILTFEGKGIFQKFGHELTDLEIKTLDAARGGSAAARYQLGLMISGHTMMASGFLLQGMGFAFLYSDDASSLITCDNPAVIAGLTKSTRKQRAAFPSLDARRVLFFPIAPDVLMFGSTTLKSGSGMIVFDKGNTLSKAAVKSANRLLGLCADRFIFLPADSPNLPNACFRNRLDDPKAASRIFNGIYSDYVCELTSRLDRMFL